MILKLDGLWASVENVDRRLIRLHVVKYYKAWALLKTMVYKRATARVVTNLRPLDHVAAVLQELLWLLIKYCIKHKLYLLVHLTLWSYTILSA